MALISAVGSIKGISRSITTGDILTKFEAVPPAIVANTILITGDMLLGGIINRATTGEGTDILYSAADILNTISLTGVTAGTSFRTTWIQASAFQITLSVNAFTAISVVYPTVNALSVKDFLVTVVNGTPVNSVAVNAILGSTVFTGMTLAQTSAITPGMYVTNGGGLGILGATVVSVQPGVGVTLSILSSVTTTAPITVTFSPVITLVGLGQGLL